MTIEKLMAISNIVAFSLTCAPKKSGPSIIGLAWFALMPERAQKAVLKVCFKCENPDLYQ